MKFKLVYIIHFLIIGLFIVSVLGGVIRLNDVLEATGDDFSFRSDHFSSSFRITLFLIVPIIGIFIKNRIGWLSISHYFYFTICNLSIMFYGLVVCQYDDYLGLIFFLLLTLSVLLIMNMQRVSFDYYKIKKENLIGINIVSFVTGFCLSLTLHISKNGSV